MVFKPVFDYRDKIFEDFDLPTGERVLVGISPHLHLQNGIAQLEHPREHLPPQVKFVGALVDQTSSADLPPWWEDVLRAGRPIVHVTRTQWPTRT